MKRTALNLSLVLTGSLTMAANAAVVGYWDFDGDFNNSLGPAANGTQAYGTTTFAAGLYGQAGSFDGASAVSIDDAVDPMSSTTFTLAYFIQAGTQDGIFERITARPSNSFFTAIADGVTVLDAGAPNVATPANLELSYWNVGGGDPGSNWFGWDNTGATASGSGWTHVAWVDDDTNMRLYIDGVLVYTGNSIINTPTGDLFLGGNSSDSNTGESYIGLLDDVLLTDNALSANDIQFIANNGVAAWVPEPGSLALLGLGGLAVLRRRR